MKYLSFILCLFLFVRCTDVINIQPENDTTYTNYFRTLKDAEALLNTLQMRVRAMMCQDKEANPHIFAGELIDSINVPYIQGPRELNPKYYTMLRWVRYYETINAADLILDNLHRFPLSAEELRPYELQAYFAKGVAYFMLAQRWGEVPITKGTTYFGKIGKSSVHDVLEEATKWAQKALDLPKFEELVDADGKARGTKQYGSKGAATALLAHIYAWRAAIEEKPEYWGEAEKYCTQIIENEVGTYQLAKSPDAVCTDVLYKNSSESIWEIYRSTEDGVVSMYSLAYVGEMYVGIPTYINVNYGGPNKYYEFMLFKDRVKRMYEETDLRRDAYFWGLEADKIYVINKNGLLTPVLTCAPGEAIATYDISNHREAYINKFRHPVFDYDAYNQTQTFQGCEICKVVWRLADIMLLRAECRCRQNKANATDDLNTIRDRAYGVIAGLSSGTEHHYKASEGDLQLAIFREREKELIFEDHRFYDIRRNGVDYVRRELPKEFGLLSDEDISNGALYLDVDMNAFTENDLMRHNVYWNQFLQ